MIPRKSKLPIERMTPLDREAEIKRRQGQEEERIDVLGGNSEKKAIPWVQKDVAEQEKKDREYFYLVSELLKRHQKKKIVYFRILVGVLQHFLKKEWISKKYFLDIEANDTGIKVELKGTKYYGAFKPCGLSNYDFMACQILAIKVGNTIGKLEGHYHKSGGGVILPDQEDKKIYG